MKENKTKIQITKIENHGRNHNLYCDTVLFLRYARKVGDIEVVNNTQLGKLNECAKTGKFSFIKL